MLFQFDNGNKPNRTDDDEDKQKTSRIKTELRDVKNRIVVYFLYDQLKL